MRLAHLEIFKFLAYLEVDNSRNLFTFFTKAQQKQNFGQFMADIAVLNQSWT